MIQKVISAQAPGKIILNGEHAAVYGERVISCAINLFCYVDIYIISSENSKFVININDATLDINSSLPNFNHDLNVYEREFNVWCTPLSLNTHILKISLKALIYLYYHILHHKFNAELYGLRIDVKSDIPIGMGLGSSAAFNVALSAAFLSLSHDKETLSNSLHPDKNLINDWAFKAETLIHGKPSGIDNFVSTNGGIVCMKSGCTQILRITNSYLQQYTKILCINSGIQRNTKRLIETVSNLYQKEPNIVKSIFSAIELCGNTLIAELELQQATNLTSDQSLMKDTTFLKEQSVDSSIKAKYDKISTVFDINHFMLCALGVNHPKLDKIRQICGENSTLLNDHSLPNGFGQGDDISQNCDNQNKDDIKTFDLTLKPKITGSGGGGFMIAFLPFVTNEFEEMHLQKCLQLKQKVLKDNGFDSFVCSFGGPGVSVTPYFDRIPKDFIRISARNNNKIVEFK